jgi:choice-of-anchor B domain-containing protein
MPCFSTRRLLFPLLLLTSVGLSIDVARGQASHNCQLLSQLVHSGSNGYSGVWGYVDPATGREFALVGTLQGTWIVETTDPTAPVERAFFPGGPASTWRESTTYRQFIYSASERQPGVQIISMQNPDQPTLVNHFTAPQWTNTHTISMDQERGLLFANGTQNGMAIYDVATDPTTPRLLATLSQLYVHDTFAQHGFAYLSAIFAGQMVIVDVSNLPTITLLGSVFTPRAFTHNTWVNSTDTIAVTSDETLDGFMQIYDITNKAAPLPLGNWKLPGSRIHNVHMRDDKIVHMSYYEAGYRTVDISDPRNPAEIGYYVTKSAWGCYPYQPSRNIYISATPSDGGLYVLRLGCGVPATYGKGTPGTGGHVPQIDWHGGYARIGNQTFQVVGREMIGGGIGFLVLGIDASNLTAVGIDILIDLARPIFILPTLIGGVGPGNGTVTMGVPLPNDPSLGNASLYAQWIVADTGGPQGLAASPGLKITMCK